MIGCTKPRHLFIGGKCLWCSYRKHRRRRATCGNGLAVLTATEIAAILNKRHGTTRNNTKNVQAVLHEAEKKLRHALLPVAAEVFSDLEAK